MPSPVANFLAFPGFERDLNVATMCVVLLGGRSVCVYVYCFRVYVFLGFWSGSFLFGFNVLSFVGAMLYQSTQ